jgi:uncharacterized protein
LSLDGPVAEITDATRQTWSGKSVHNQLLTAMERLRGCDAWSVIATCTDQNLEQLVALVESSPQSSAATSSTARPGASW